MPELTITPESIVNQPEKRYNNHDYVAPYRPHLLPQFKIPKENGVFVYRSCIKLPPSEIDQTPLQLRPHKPNKKIKSALTYAEVDEKDEATRYKEICHYALSVNDSIESAIASLDIKLANLKEKNLPKEQIDRMMSNRGLIILAFLMCPNHGLITDFINGHGNILLYEGVTLKDMMVPGFVPYQYKYEL